jgi:D-glycero-alpha-D-manno-heptose-7-phosphate kinase
MIVTRAVHRIPLGGGGTDLPSYYSEHGGFILSAGIDKYVYICLNRPAADDLIRIKYSRYEQVEVVDEIEHDLVKPALRVTGITSNVEITSIGDVPTGTGLGSSGTYLVSLLTALYELKRERVPLQTIAEQACHIEMNLAGHPVGKHDHYLAAFGGFTCLDIQKDGTVTVSPLNISRGTVEQLRNNLLLFFTGIDRSSRDILQAQKEDTLSGKSEVVDSLHHTKELGYQIKALLEDGDVDQFGRLMDRHWQNKKRRSANISNATVDQWYQLAKDSGALGGKIMGAGGGGFLLIYCPSGTRSSVREVLKTKGLRETPFDFDFSGAKTLFNV